jgi:hypothetical protein
MPREKLDQMLEQLNTLRQQSLTALVDLREDEFSVPTAMPRWDDIRRVLLRFGDHVREHANQIEGARAATGCIQTMPQRMLAESEISWGKLRAATFGLEDEDISVKPPDGGWSVEEVLQHIIKTEKGYLDAILAARQKK